MKALVLTLLATLVSASAFATVDGNTRVYIVAHNYQDETEFFVERVPVIGCYGLAKGPQLVQFTAPYKVTSNIGCGGQATRENINALTCAKVVDSEESSDYSTFSKIKLDISACPQKNNAKFITMVRTAASLNFSTKQQKVQLELIK